MVKMSDAYCECLIALALALARVVNYAPRLMLQNVVSLCRLQSSLMIIIFDHNMFIVHVAGSL
jgi:hypothetical protein